MRRNRLRVVSATLCATTACASYIVVFYQQRGLNEAAIGRVLSLSGALSLAMPFVWSYLCDRLRRPARVLAVNLGCTALFRLAAGFLPGWFGVAAQLAAIASACAAIPLLDTLLLAAPGGAYAKLRSWGVIAQAAAILALGAAGEAFAARYGFGFCALLSVLPILLLLRAPEGASAARVSQKPRLGALFKTPGFPALMLFGVFLYLPVMATSNYAIYVFNELGGAGAWFGVNQALRIVMQAPGLLAGRALAAKYRQTGVLVISCALLAVECVSYSVIGAAWQIVLAGALFGFAYGMISGAVVARADELAPASLRSSAQAAGLPLMLAAGDILNGLAGGALLKPLGVCGYFRLCALVCLCAGLWYGLYCRKKVKLNCQKGNVVL